LAFIGNSVRAGHASGMQHRIAIFLPAIAAALAGATPVLAGAPGSGRGNPEQGGADIPVIPEPMLFDMIRPLGARRGELEANVLATSATDGGALLWAPEVEMALADGFAVELELPSEGARINALKLGVQGTIGTGLNGRLVHGIQYLGQTGSGGRWESSLLYLAGLRHGRHWSSMMMLGLKSRTTLSRPVTLINHSLFRDVGRRTTAGLEFNRRGGSDGNWLLLPQLHQRVGSHLVMQAGAGVDKPRGTRATPLASLRLVREF
jgi:hypothetical protein